MITSKAKMYDVKPMLPFVGGGVVPGLVPKFMNDAGNDVLLGVGAGIHAHQWDRVQAQSLSEQQSMHA